MKNDKIRIVIRETRDQNKIDVQVILPEGMDAQYGTDRAGWMLATAYNNLNEEP